MSFIRKWSSLLGLGLLCCAINATAQDKNHLVDVVYGHKLGCALTMDVFKPEKPNGIGVIWMVSGGWVSNHNNISAPTAKPYTDRGQTVFEVVHGSNPRFTLPEIVQDINRAVRYIRTHAAEYGVDPDKLAVCGGSAGGHLSLFMAAYGSAGDPNAKDPVDRASSKVACTAIFYPPTDFLNYGKMGDSAFEIPTLKSYYPVFAIPAGSTTEDKIKIGKSLSPIYGLSTETGPVLIIHGNADTLVPIQQSELVMAKLEELHVDHKLIVRPGKGHGWAGIENDLPILADWIQDHLGKK